MYLVCHAQTCAACFVYREFSACGVDFDCILSSAKQGQGKSVADIEHRKCCRDSICGRNACIVS